MLSSSRMTTCSIFCCCACCFPCDTDIVPNDDPPVLQQQAAQPTAPHGRHHCHTKTSREQPEDLEIFHHLYQHYDEMCKSATGEQDVDNDETKSTNIGVLDKEEELQPHHDKPQQQAQEHKEVDSSEVLFLSSVSYPSSTPFVGTCAELSFHPGTSKHGPFASNASLRGRQVQGGYDTDSSCRPTQEGEQRKEYHGYSLFAAQKDEIATPSSSAWPSPSVWGRSTTTATATPVDLWGDHHHRGDHQRRSEKDWMEKNLKAASSPRYDYASFPSPLLSTAGGICVHPPPGLTLSPSDDHQPYYSDGSIGGSTPSAGEGGCGRVGFVSPNAGLTAPLLPSDFLYPMTRPRRAGAVLVVPSVALLDLPTSTMIRPRPSSSWSKKEKMVHPLCNDQEQHEQTQIQHQCSPSRGRRHLMVIPPSPPPTVTCIDTPTTATTRRTEINISKVTMIDKQRNNLHRDVNLRPFQICKWSVYFRQAIIFTQRHGHCRIPEVYPQDRKLGRWAKTQRYLYMRQLKQHQDSVMVTGNNAASKQKNNKPSPDTNSSMPVESTTTPSVTKASDGSSRRTASSGPVMEASGNNEQDDGYHLTEERLRLLNEIGFAWDLRASTWLTRYQELCIFKEMHGHTQVPSTFQDNPKLSVWVRTQRRSNNVGLLSDERKRLLDNIGFQWGSVRG